SAQPGPHSHPGRVLLQSISGVEVQYPGKGSGLTCRSTAHGANRNQTEPQSQPHSHPTRVLLQSISGVGVQYPGKGSGVPVGAPPTVRTAIEPRLRASPHSHPGRVLLQSISGVEVQYPGKGSGVPVGAPPTVRTGQAHTRTRGGCSYNKYPNWNPGRVLLRQIREFAPVAGAPPMNTRLRTRGSCSYNTYATSLPSRLLLPREGVGCLPLTSPAHHLQRHPIPGRGAPAVLLHTRSYCSLLLDHSLHENRFI